MTTDYDSDNGLELIRAVITNDVACVRELLAAGADVNARICFEGGTALHYAVGHCNIEIVRLLLIAGARLDISDKQWGTVMEMISYNRWVVSAQKRSDEVVELLRELRPDELMEWWVSRGPTRGPGVDGL